MRNFDDLDLAEPQEKISVGGERVELSETVTINGQPLPPAEPVARTSQSRGFLIHEDWDWKDLRDYVVHQIEERWGEFPRDFRKESSIFKSFLARWPEQAQQIAKYAFEVEGGRWRGAPIGVNRFCKASDLWFASVIAERLVSEPVSDW